MHKKIIFFSFLLLCCLSILPAVLDTRAKEKIVPKDDLVEISLIDPTIRTHIIYATAQNFTKQTIYSSARCYLRRPVAEQLKKVQQTLNKQGLGLLIWDGYRPLPAQWKLWNICPDEKYVSDPRKGGRHTRGTAVDVTLVSLNDGSLLPMPTDFDDFSKKAWRNYDKLAENIKNNRALLQKAMEDEGFIGLPTEWWHFDYRNWESYEPLSVDFDQLA